MPTNEERREVARRLRELDYSDLQESLICAYLDALGIDGYTDWIGIARYLADFIEPNTDAEDAAIETALKWCHRASKYQKELKEQRDALLVLADDMANMAKEAEPIGFVFHWRLLDYANRIRETCGV